MNKRFLKASLVFIITLFFMSDSSSVFSDDDLPETLSEYQTRIRRNILNNNFTDMRSAYTEAKEQAAEYIVEKLYALVMENPDVNLDPVKDIIEYYESKKELSPEEIEFYKESKFREKNIEYMRKTLFDMLKKDFKSAMTDITTAIEWTDKEAEVYADASEPQRMEIKQNQLNERCDQAIIKAILAGKKNLPVPDAEILNLWKNKNIYADELLVHRYLTMLIIYNRSDEFSKTVSADNFTPPLEQNSIFRYRENAEIYFEWFACHSYWLTPEFTSVLSKLKASEVAKYRSAFSGPSMKLEKR